MNGEIAGPTMPWVICLVSHPGTSIEISRVTDSGNGQGKHITPTCDLHLNYAKMLMVRRPVLEPPVKGARHPVLKGFDETDIMSFGGLLEPVRTDPGAEVLMTFIPQFPIYPPETAWMREPITDIPGSDPEHNTGGSSYRFYARRS